MTALVIEQPPLALEAARVTRETSVGADDAVAGDDDRDGIFVVGHTDGARRARPPDPRRELAVRGGGPDGDRAESAPHELLEGRSRRGHREPIERPHTAAEIRAECPTHPEWVALFSKSHGACPALPA